MQAFISKILSLTKRRQHMSKEIEFLFIVKYVSHLFYGMGIWWISREIELFTVNREAILSVLV